MKLYMCQGIRNKILEKANVCCVCVCPCSIRAYITDTTAATPVWWPRFGGKVYYSAVS